MCLQLESVFNGITRVSIFNRLFFISPLSQSLLLAVRISFSVFTYYFRILTDPGLRKIRHSSLVCRRGFAVIIVLALTGQEVLTLQSCGIGRTTKSV